MSRIRGVTVVHGSDEGGRIPLTGWRIRRSGWRIRIAAPAVEDRYPYEPPRVDEQLDRRLRESVAKRFAEMNPIFDQPSPMDVRIPGPAGFPGDVVVGHWGDGLIVYIGDMTHVHFDEGDAGEMAERCCDFLQDLFNDKVVVHGSAYRGGGWFYPEHCPGLRPSREMVTWSGPWADLTAWERLMRWRHTFGR